MAATLELIVPVFAVVALGFLAARHARIGEGGGAWLSAFVFNFAIPGLLFRTLARQGAPDASALRLLVAYYVPALLVFAGGFALARAARADARTSVVSAMGSSYGNCALLGMPLVLGAYGEAGATPFFLLLAVHGPLLMSLPAVCCETLDGAGQGVAGLLRQTARGLIQNPIVVAIVAGSLYGASGLGLAPMVDDTLAMLGRAAVPCALFALGASLSRYGFAGRPGLTSASTVLKMAALPAMVWLAGAWLGLSQLDRGVATLTAAMPTGVNVFLFAERYRADLSLASSNVVVATAAAVPSLTLCLWLLR